jgi:hypothetical protein
MVGGLREGNEMKIRVILLSGLTSGAPGFIEDIIETEVRRTSSGKFGVGAQRAMNDFLEHLSTGKWATVEIVKEENK